MKELEEKIKNILEENFLEYIETSNITKIDLRNYRVLNITSVEGDKISKSIFCKTNAEAWPCEFNILFIPIVKDYHSQLAIDSYLQQCFSGEKDPGTPVMILVSEDCPGCYFIENQDIIEVSKKLYSLTELDYVKYNQYLNPENINQIFRSSNGWTSSTDNWNVYCTNANTCNTLTGLASSITVTNTNTANSIYKITTQGSSTITDVTC